VRARELHLQDSAREYPPREDLSHQGGESERSTLRSRTDGRGAARRGRIKTADFAEPIDVPQLQAADVLAYEMAKVQRDRPQRYPFLRLLEGSKARGIPMTPKWGPFTRISDRIDARMRGEQPV
jgi:hypothetical protein